MLLHGKGVEEDHERGVQLVRRAADAGDVYAGVNLARWYTDGRYGERRQCSWYRQGFMLPDHYILCFRPDNIAIIAGIPLTR